MKKRKLIAVLIVLLIVVPLVLVLINRLRASALNKEYPALGQTISGEKFMLIELAIPGTKLYNQSVDSEHRDPLQETDEMGYISYRPATQQFIIRSQEHLPGGNNDWRVHISYFDSDGKLVNHESALYDVKADLSGTIILKNYIAIYQKWKDDKKDIYLRHFGIEDMSPSCLNPFTLGGINGSAPCYVWAGSGYFELYVNGDTLRFRSPTEKGELFFTERNAYSTNLSYYKLPVALKQPLPAFLLYMPRDGKPRLFMVRGK